MNNTFNNNFGAGVSGIQLQQVTIGSIQVQGSDVVTGFDFDKWMEAFAECGISVDEYTGEIPEDKELPWDVIDNGVTKAYLLKEKHLAYEGVTTPNCMGKCNGCGASKLGRCFE